MRRALGWLLVVLGAAACAEELTTPGGCPELCPGGPITVRDTFLTAIPSGDSAFTGFGSVTDASSLLLANAGGPLTESLALIRFIARGDTVIVQDTTRTFVVDSVKLNLALQDRDTTKTGLVLDIYRVPQTLDTLASFAELTAAMVPAALLRSVPIPDSFKAGALPVIFSGAELSKFTFVAADSTRLAIGLRVRAPSQAGVYVGALNSGTTAPTYVTYTTVNEVADTILRKREIVRGVLENVTVRAGDLPFSIDLLQVGGFPAARSLIRFALPLYLRDSVTILRATLELVLEEPVAGIPGDSARIDARTVVADFGAKSPIVVTTGASTWIQPGGDTVRIEIGPLVNFWQGTEGLPPVLRLNHGQEFGSFLVPRFRSTRSPSGAPRVRITYRPRFVFERF